MNGAESSGSDGHDTLKGKLREELRKYLIVSAYLYVCFAALQLYKTALLLDAGVHYAPLGVAVVKALIVGKFLLIGDAIQGRTQRRPGHLPGRIARRLFWLLSILILLTIAEELIVGWIHGHGVAEVEEEFHARSKLELLAEVLLMGLILVPLVAAAEASRALGPGVLRRQLLRPADGDRGQSITTAPATGNPHDPGHRAVRAGRRRSTGTTMLGTAWKALPMNHDNTSLGGRRRQPGDFGAWPRSALAVLWTTAVLAGPPAAHACGYHDPSGYIVGMLNWAYPDALHVRTAVWMAQGEGLLARAAPVIDADPASPAHRLQQMMRLRQTQAGLEALRDGLDAAADDRALPAIAVVLIGPMLWTRFERADGVLVMASHVAGPTPGDVVIVTDEPVVAALVDGRLTPLAARERGLVKFYGDAQNAAQVSTWFEGLVPTPGRQASRTHTPPEPR